jgi:hypothetical protein
VPEIDGLDRRLGAILFLFVSAVYIFCAYPFIAPRDSADLSLAALTLGVAHPPGYPLYAVLGKLWLILLPWGNPAYRLNLLSAVGGAAACAVLYYCARRWTSRGPALASALALAFCAPLWKFSLLGEMYSLHALVLAALLCLVEGAKRSLIRRAALSGLIFGLGLVNHQSLILFIPGWLLMWQGELRRHESSWEQIFEPVIGFILLGWALYVFVWIRLADLSQAWSVITRAQYGTFTLSGGFARPLTGKTANALLFQWADGCAWASSPLILFLFLAGFAQLRKNRPEFSKGILLALLAMGPAYFLMTRFDLSEWVAKTVLESAFAASLVLICLLGAVGLAAVRRFGDSVAAFLAAAVVVIPLWLNAARMDHRQDFSAYDYIHDLRRGLPPGSNALVGGDTALFGLRFMEAWQPREVPLELRGSGSEPDPGWAAGAANGGGLFVLGLPISVLRQWGLVGGALSLQLQGLVQEALPQKPTVGGERAAWALSALRWGPALASGESYAHDIRLAYAFAHYLSARLEEFSGPGEPIEHDRWARLLDPEDYRIEWVPAKDYNSRNAAH